MVPWLDDICTIWEGSLEFMIFGILIETRHQLIHVTELVRAANYMVPRYPKDVKGF
jgi:hypothetical protein